MYTFVNAFATMGLLVVLAIPSVGVGQEHDARSSDELAADYVKGVLGIQDELDSLGKELKNPNLRMNDAAKIIDRRSALQGRADDLFNSAQRKINDSFRQTRDSIIEYNNRNKLLDFTSAAVGSTGDVLNNLPKYPRKAEFEKNIDQMSRAWEKNYGTRLKPFDEEFAQKKEELFNKVRKETGIDLSAEGFRIGTSNPYTGVAYYRYFDGNGDLKGAVYNKEADTYERVKKDFEAQWRRQIDLKAQLEKQATTLMQSQERISESSNSLRSRMSSVEATASSRMRSLEEAAQAARQQRLLEQQQLLQQQQRQMTDDEYYRLYGTRRRGYAK